MVTAFDTRFNPPFPTEPSDVWWLIDPFTQNIIDQLSADRRFRKLGVACIDLSHRSRSADKPGFTTFAGWNMRDTYFVASMMKIAAMTATYMLRESFELALNEVDSDDKNEAVQLVIDDWREAVETAVPDGRRDFPKINDIFDISGGRGNWRLKFTSSEMGHLENMMVHSDNHSSSVVIDRVGFQYLNGTLAGHGLYEPGSGGMWLGGNYAGRNWKIEPVSKKTHMAGTAHHIAMFLTLLEQGQLVNARASQEMRALMSRAGSFFFEGLQRSRRTPGWSYYKIGLAGTASDCGVMERSKNGKKVRYAAVALGASDPQILRDLIVKLDDYIFATEADLPAF